MEQVTKLHFLVLGDCGTGKTTLVQHFLHDQALSQTLPTMVYDLAVKRIDDVTFGTLEFWVWDAAGDDRSHQNQAYQQLYYAKKNGIILLYDMTSLDSFINVRDRWLPRLRSAQRIQQSQWRLCLVANKQDLAHQREVTTEEGRQLAHDHGMEYMELSSLEGFYEDMRQPFLLLAVQLIQSSAVKPEQSRSIILPTIIQESEKKESCCT